jgi:hypothetical protein
MSDNVIGLVIISIIAVSVMIFGKAGLMIMLIPFAVLSYNRSQTERIGRRPAPYKTISESVKEIKASFKKHTDVRIEEGVKANEEPEVDSVEADLIKLDLQANAIANDDEPWDMTDDELEEAFRLATTEKENNLNN